MVSEKLVEVMLVTLLPWAELRGAIPLGIAYGLNPLLVFVFAVGLNIALIPVIFFFLDRLFPYFEHWKITQSLLSHVRRKTEPYVKKYGFLGLTIFTAIPFPGSGVYSACLASDIFDVPREKAVAAIAWGVLIAGAIVTLLSVGVLSLF